MFFINGPNTPKFLSPLLWTHSVKFEISKAKMKEGLERPPNWWWLRATVAHNRGSNVVKTDAIWTPVVAAWRECLVESFRWDSMFNLIFFSFVVWKSLYDVNEYESVMYAWIWMLLLVLWLSVDVAYVVDTIGLSRNGTFNFVKTNEAQIFCLVKQEWNFYFCLL